ncbi:protein kinase domain-containing protein [Nocardia sp. R7R-8]|uniref:protein kinase domain-containing protein n=1 Tax=Nocardia sp. R7R-8 TaxID=3459304 RepID=UPI00403D935F
MQDEETKPDLGTRIEAELAAAGFGDAQEIGRGGFGVVYRCVENFLDRVVAVKVLDSEVTDEERSRFLREQRSMGSFAAHPHIVQVLHAELTASGRAYLVMPFHSRGSLLERIRADGPLPWEEVLSVGVKIAGALATAHIRGTVHRDVNPDNILLTDYGEPQLSDFGIACMVDGFVSADGFVAGTPAFIAPEVLQGAEPAPSGDIYSLGATLFCLLTGRAAFERQHGESLVAQFVRITCQPVPDLRGDGVPASLCAAIESAMATNPAERPVTAQAFGEVLRNVQYSAGLAVDSMMLPAEVQIPRAEASKPRRPETGGELARALVPTPSTRYRPPTASRPPVQRRHLLDTLRDGGPRRLVLIHGPAGFGKSTLASEWADVLVSQGVRVGWLSVDSDDNNVIWFLSHLIEAVRRAFPEVATGLTAMLEERSGDAVQQVMATVIDEIHRNDQPVAVVVDDWHRVTSPTAIEAMEFLLDRGCHHLRMVITSRSRKGLPLGRMRVRDELIEIDEVALRFDDDEAAAFLADIDGLSLTPEEVNRLRESTEGWAAALQLASLSLRGQKDPGAYISRVSGRNFAIGEYLMENVIGRLEPEVIEFLMRTAVSDRICGDLAELLTGVPSGQEMLEEIRQRDLFLRGLDDDLQWFRYHGLFADFLRRTLIRRHPGLLEELHLVSSEWFAMHGFLAEAVDHALSADAADRAITLVEDHAEELLLLSRNATFSGLAAKLPESLTNLAPRLQIQTAWADITVQRPTEASAALDRAEALLAAASADGEAALEIMLARTAIALITDHPARIPDQLAALADRQPRPFLAQALALTTMMAALYRFDFVETDRWHQWLQPYRPLAQGPFALMHADCFAGMAAAERLDVEAAETLYRNALQLALKTGSQSHATRLASSLLGELLYEKGQFIEAEQLIETGMHLEGGMVDYPLAAYGTGVRLAAVRGELAAVEQRLEEGADMAAELRLPRLAARIVNERVRLGLPISDGEREALENLGPFVEQTTRGLALAAELEQDSAIRLLLSEGSAESADRARRRAERLVRRIARQQRPRALLHAQLLYGCCLAATGKTAQATSMLHSALDRCAEQGLVRVVVDSGRRLLPIIEMVYSKTTRISGPTRPFLRQVLAEFEQQ